MYARRDNKWYTVYLNISNYISIISGCDFDFWDQIRTSVTGLNIERLNLDIET